jgi:hypothetical protein
VPGRLRLLDQPEPALDRHQPSQDRHQGLGLRALAAVLAIGMLGEERQLRSDVGESFGFSSPRPTGTGSCTASADAPRTGCVAHG